MVPTSPKPIPPALVGKRAANKADKLRRITSAARELFVSNGFDGTTMRGIAARAGVGFGTIFDYASNKRDLLFLICNPELEEVLDRSGSHAATQNRFIDRMMALFGAYYRYYAQTPTLSRIMLRELTFFTDGEEARKFVTHRARFMSLVSDHVSECVADGQLSAANTDLVTRLVFGLYAWEVRRWLADETLNVDRGLAELAQLIEIQIEGFAPRSA